jgi:hypothetical protein
MNSLYIAAALVLHIADYRSHGRFIARKQNAITTLGNAE